MNRIGMVVVICVFATLAHAAEIRKWKDKNGQVHYGDRPPQNVASEQVIVRPNVYDSPSIEDMSNAFATKNSVVMYSASWCKYCKRARNYFRANNIPFEEYDVETTEKGKSDYAELGANGVPVILYGSHRLNGFSVSSFRQIYRP